MTPEELEAIPSIGSETVEKILVAVNGYYAQFEPGSEAAAPPLEAVPESSDASFEAAGAEPAGDSEAAEITDVASGNGSDAKKEFDTIENSEGVV